MPTLRLTRLLLVAGRLLEEVCNNWVLFKAEVEGKVSSSPPGG